MADYALVKEKMVELGEVLAALGYDSPQEIIEGHGPVGRSCADCRGPEQAKTVALYLKDLHQTFATLSPDDVGNKDKAVVACQAAWREVRAALSDDPDTAQAVLERDLTAAPSPTAAARKPVASPMGAISMGRGMPSMRIPVPGRR